MKDGENLRAMELVSYAPVLPCAGVVKTCGSSFELPPNYDSKYLLLLGLNIVEMGFGY